MLGGTKQRYIWTVNGTLWSIIDSLAGSKILAEMYGDNFTSTMKIPESLFDAEFIEAKDLRYIDQVLAHQPIAGYSSRLLRSDYAGFSTEIQRASDNMKQDIGFEDSFNFDVPAFDAFTAATTGSGRTWYDQFNANDALQVTMNRMPAITTGAGANNRPAYFYQGTQCRLPIDSLAAIFNGTNKPFTTLAVLKSTDMASLRSYLSVGNTANNNPFLALSFTNAPAHQFSLRDDALSHQIFNGTVPVINLYNIVGFMYNPPDLYELFNGTLTKTTLGALGAITLDRLTIGAFGRIATTNFWKGNIDEFLIWDSFTGIEDFVQASYNMSQFYAVY